VCFVLFIVCLYICVCECLLQNNNHKTKHKNNTTSKHHPRVRGPLQECRLIRSGASGLLYYCAPLVCVSEVIELLAVWRYNKPKTNKKSEVHCVGCNNGGGGGNFSKVKQLVAPVGIGNDRPCPPHQDTTDLHEAIPRQRQSSTYSPLSPSTTCGQTSPEALGCPLVTPSELTQVIDLLALFAGVVSTPPVVVSTWSTLLGTPSSTEGVFMVPQVRTVPAPTQRLNHALGGPASPSRNTSVVVPVTTHLAKSSGHGLGANKSPSTQGAKGEEPMEIDDNDLEHLSYGLELDEFDDDLTHSTMVRDNHDLVSEGDRMQEDFFPTKKLKKRPPRPSRSTPSQKDRRKTVVTKHAI